MAEWHYTSGGVQVGPIGAAELKRLAQSGQLQRTDMIWKDGMADWVPAAKVKGLFDGVAAATAIAAPAPVPAGLQPVHEAPAPLPDAPMSGQPAGVIAYDSGGAGVPVTPRTIEMLRQTKPWVLLFSILMFIGFGFIVIFSLIGIAGTFAMGGARGGAVGAISGLVNVAFGLLYFFPAMFLSRYSSRIGSLVKSGRADSLEAALEAQKSFWKFTGILTLISICIMIIIVIAIVVLGVAGASGAF